MLIYIQANAIFSNIISFFVHVPSPRLLFLRRRPRRVTRYRGVTIPQKGDSDSRGLRPKRLKEPTPGESDSNFFISKIGKNKTPTPGGLRAKRSKEPTPGESDSRNRHASKAFKEGRKGHKLRFNRFNRNHDYRFWRLNANSDIHTRFFHLPWTNILNNATWLLQKSSVQLIIFLIVA